MMQVEIDRTDGVVIRWGGGGGEFREDRGVFFSFVGGR